MRYHFVGIAGSGMSSLAQLIRGRGDEVTGSDRSFDRQGQEDLRAALGSLGIKIYRQDGSGVDADTQEVIFSTAVEKENLDLSRAMQLAIPLTRRAALLAQLFDRRFGIAIAGTSGKSTVAAMVATILRTLGMDPTYYGGAALLDGAGAPCLANAFAGSGKFFCAETDESDGSLLEFHPKVSVITNITQDHKPVSELRDLFARFILQTEKILVLSADCPVTRALDTGSKQVLWYGTDKRRFPLTIESASIDGTRITWKGVSCHVPLPGMHNVSNALAALSVAETVDIPLAAAAKALESFKGLHRRLELVGRANGICVFDDYAHNPAKIEATLKTLQEFFPRVLAVFQLHGFGPARFMMEGLQELFTRILRDQDRLILPDIYDAGGTADRSVSAQDLITRLCSTRPDIPAVYLPSRPRIAEFLKHEAQPGDAIVIMGARDSTLSAFCKKIFSCLSP